MKKMLLPVLFAVLFFVQCKKEDAGGGDRSLNNKLVGASANEFLSAAKYKSVNLQIQYMPGYEPDAQALLNLMDYLNMLTNKPAGFTYTKTQIAASGKASLSLADITAVETANRTNFSSGNVLSVYVLYTDAPFSTNNVLGISYKNTSLALFGPTITSNSGGLNQTSRTKLETTVHEHEFGHLLGLVDLGSSMVTNHKDAAHGAHCTNTSCLMYYETESAVIGGLLLGGPVPELDANCRADLRANGGK